MPCCLHDLADAQTGHGTSILKPSVSDMFDFEGELAVIIGKTAEDVQETEAMDYVAGYSCFNDGSARDWQKHSSQFTAGKNFYRSAGFGPWMVSSDEIDPAQLQLTTRVNGIVKQNINTSQMIFSIAYLVSYVSRFTPLSPGDVVVTGTPSGFGSKRNPPEFLQVGDVIEVEIGGVGVLRNIIASS
ncbi:fumarylacetoacetate hydrolase family protein [Rhizobium sp. 28DA2]|uniref:fumarylacetoacetate hydrolase family protein n=1 Tax=Rhizobium sp. 28DA2 TaxID=3035209 RepID=UPI0034E8CD39